MTKPLAPVREIGYSQAVNYNWWLFDEESTPELVWPQSIAVYDSMRKQDAQVASVLKAVTLLVRCTPWRVDPNGARDEVVKFVAEDLGLPIVGRPTVPPRRTKDKFSWSEHLRLALLMLPFGHSYFEQVYRVDPDGQRAHLRKLALRPSKTIERIDVAPDGGLISIKQYWTKVDEQPKPIPVDRLVAYVNDREGGNWLGSSILRGVYKNWLLKDRLLRVQAQTIERNGMGVPLYKAAETETELTTGLGMATSWRAGEAAGSAIPFGADLVLRGVEGTLPDAEPAVRYHDEQIARQMLAHFLNLGTQTGSWALGTTFADFFTLSVQTVAESMRDTATQHVVEDLVDVNWGESEPAPRLVFDQIGSQQAATAAAIKTLVDAGVIRPDQVLEESSRQQYGLPPADSSTERTAPAGGESGPKAPASPEAPDPSVRPGSVAASYEQAALDDEWDAWDEATDALTHVLAAFDESKHLRNPKGHEGGGRFRSMVDRLTDALTQHHKGGGKGDPFEGFDREQLRRVAVKRGIKFKRGASRDEISHALTSDLGKGHVDAPAKPKADVPDKPAPKKRTPRKKAAPKVPAKDDRPEPAITLEALDATPTYTRVLMEAGLTPAKRAELETKLKTVTPKQAHRLGGDTLRATLPEDAPPLAADVRHSISRSVSSYMTDGYKPINRALYANANGEAVPDDVAQRVDDLDLLFSMSHLDSDVMVHRGTRTTDIPEEWTSHGFSSTTALPGVADQFAHGSFHGTATGAADMAGTPTVLDIRVPKGHPAVQLTDESIAAEVLLPRGTRYRKVADRGVIDGVHHVEVEVVPWEGQPSLTAGTTKTNLPQSSGRPKRPRTKKATDPLTGESALGAPPASLSRTDDGALTIGNGPKWSEAEREAHRLALVKYRDNEYIFINSLLRRGDEGSTPWVQSSVDAVDRVMAASPLASDIVVMRGISDPGWVFPDHWDDHDVTGMEWVEKAYMSTTADAVVADDFAKRGADPVRMNIRVPKGTGAIQLSDATDESEVLLQRGLRMRVVADRGMVGGFRVLDVEVVPREPAN